MLQKSTFNFEKNTDLKRTNSLLIRFISFQDILFLFNQRDFFNKNGFLTHKIIFLNTLKIFVILIKMSTKKFVAIKESFFRLHSNTQISFN